MPLFELPSKFVLVKITGKNMVYKRPFANSESCEHASKHPRHLGCSGQLASCSEISSCRGITLELPVSECKDPLGQSHCEDSPGVGNNCVFSVINKELETLKDDLLVNGYSVSAACEVSKFSLATDSNCEVVSSYVRGHKSPTRLDQSCRKNSFAESQSISGNCERPPYSVVADEALAKNKGCAFQKDFAESAHDSTSCLPLLTCGPSGGIELEPPVRLCSFPGYFEDEHRMTRISQIEDLYSPIFDYPYRKPVAIGPNHQADIPPWQPQRYNRSSGRSDDSIGCRSASESVHLLVDEGSSEKLVGVCVMPMPASGFSASKLTLRGSTDCMCVDKGSIRCARQHVMEAREKLKHTLGHETFTEVGFCDMGEDVAKRWSEKEEQVFQEVVLSNPASLGKNFWDTLRRVFASRSHKELVSYYFNVFMLRKRAEQNRLDPLNVDSDNDEWQESDDGESEEEDDSVLESPTHGYGHSYNYDGRMTDIHEGSDSDDFTSSSDDKEGLCDVSEQHIDCTAKNLQGHAEDCDVQDDSCTSYEGQQNGAESYGGPADMLEVRYGPFLEHKFLDRDYRNNVTSGLSDYGYDVGHDLRTWDMGYLCGTNNHIDFLPTCNVIEEVFGKGTWEEAMNGHGVM